MDDIHIEKLKDPNLLSNILNELKKKGICGNEHVSISILIISSLRFCRNARPTSGNVLLSSSTGTGKDETIKRLLSTIATKDKNYFHRTGLSDKVFRYWSTPTEDIKSWNNVIMYLEDPEDELLNGQTFRTIASGQNETSTVKDQEVLHIKIKGKPIFIVTSMKATIDLEGSRRWCSIPTDSNKQLNRDIQNTKIDRHLHPDKYKFDKDLWFALTDKLKSYEVLIPNLKILEGYLEPTTINNTLFETLCDYIKGSAVLHQYQREIKNNRLIANDDDIFNGLFVFRMVHQLNGGSSSFLENNVISAMMHSSKTTLFKRDILMSYNSMYDAGMTDYKMKKVLNTLIAKGRVSFIMANDKDSNRSLEAYFIRNLVNKKETNFNEDLNTNLPLGDKKDIKDLNTISPLGNKNFTIYLNIMRNRAKKGLDNNIYLTLLNHLITKSLIRWEVIKSLKNALEDLITKKEAIE